MIVDNLCYTERPLYKVDDVNDINILIIWEGENLAKFIAHAELGERAGLLAEGEYLKNNCLSFCVRNISVDLFTQLYRY